MTRSARLALGSCAVAAGLAALAPGASARSCIDVRIMRHGHPVLTIGAVGKHTILSAGTDGGIRMWSAHNGFGFGQLDTRGRIHAMARSTPSRHYRAMLLAAANDRGELEIWDLHKQERLTIIKVKGGKALRLKFDYEAQHLQVFHADRKIRWYSVEHGKPVQQWGQNEPVVATTSPQRHRVIYLTRGDAGLNIWNLENTWGTPATVQDDGARGRITGPLRFVSPRHPSRTRPKFTTLRFVAALGDGSVGRWEVNATTPPQIEFKGVEMKTAGVTALATWFETVAAGTRDGRIHVRIASRTARTAPQDIVLRGHTGPVTGVLFIDHLVVSGSKDGTIRMWDPRQPKEKKQRSQFCLMSDGPPSTSLVVRRALRHRGTLQGMGPSVAGNSPTIRFRDVPDRIEGPPNRLFKDGLPLNLLPEAVRRSLAEEPQLYLHGPTGVRKPEIHRYVARWADNCEAPRSLEIYGIEDSGHKTWFVSRTGILGGNNFVPASHLVIPRPADLTDREIGKVVRAPFQSVTTFELPGGKKGEILVVVRGRRFVSGSGYVADYVTNANYVFLRTPGEKDMMLISTDVSGMDKCGRQHSKRFMGTLRYGADSIPDLLLGPNPYMIVERTPEGDFGMSVRQGPCMC